MHPRLPRGNECQCVGCGRFFTGESAFDAHLDKAGRGDGATVTCVEPGEAGLEARERAGGRTWGWPGQEGGSRVWEAGKREAGGDGVARELVFIDPFK